jgi:hypothetical protein
MNKADYVHLLKEACGGKCNAEYNPCAYRQAADKLAALKPIAWKYDWYDETEDENGEPVKGIVNDWIAGVYSEVSDPTIGAHNIRPLYALEDNNETF